MYLPAKKGLKCKHQLDKKNDADKTNNSHAQGVLSIGMGVVNVLTVLLLLSILLINSVL